MFATNRENGMFQRNSRLSNITGHCTKGVDMFVTQQRMIVLDFPPLLSPGVMDATGRDGSNMYAALASIIQTVLVKM